MRKMLVISLLVGSIYLMYPVFTFAAAPTIDGDISDAAYTTVGTYTSGQDGFGAGNDLGAIHYYSDGTDIYIGISCDLNSNNNVVLFFNFSGYGGRGTGTLAGSSSSSTGVFTTSGGGLDGAKMDMDVDYAFAFNEGNSSTEFYMDAARFASGSNGYLSTAYIGDFGHQDGTSASLDPTSVTGGTGNITLAYNNTYSSDTNKGIEFKIPIAAFAGADNGQTLQLFTIITNNTGYMSNECIPGDPGSSNLGNDADLSAISGQDFFTSTADGSLPVTLASFTGEPTKAGVQLNWITESEVNNQGFIIERSLNDAKSYQEIASFKNNAELKGSGSTSERHVYSFVDSRAVAGNTYWYRLEDVAFDGTVKVHDDLAIQVKVDNQFDGPLTYSMKPAYPNPFNATTLISYSIPDQQHVTILLYNVRGEVVRTLYDAKQSAGNHSLSIGMPDLPSGIYFVQMSAARFSKAQEIVLLK